MTDRHTALEERLTAALGARADLVVPEDLRPAAPPRPEARVLPLRRPVVTVLAAAAACAAIAAPFVLLGGDDGAPQPAPAPSPSVELPPDVGADWPVDELQTTEVDLDGDGVDEPIEVRVDSAPDDGVLRMGPQARIEVTLSGSGQGLFGVVDAGGTALNAVGVVDADGDGTRELVMSFDPGDPDDPDGRREARVLQQVDGYLVEVPVRDAELLVSDTVGSDDGETSYLATTWIEDETLYSSRSVAAYAVGEPGGDGAPLPETYVADVWAWGLDGDELVPQPQEQLCIPASAVDGSEGRACADGEGDALPRLFPTELETIGLGESATATDDLDLDGEPDTIALVGRTADGQVVADGDVELVVTLSSTGELRLPLVAGGEPEVYLRTVQAGMVDGVSLLVSRESGDSTTLTYVSTGAEGFAGPLRATGESEATGAPLGNGFFSGRPGVYRTWLGPGGTLYTAVFETPVPDAETPAEVFVWSGTRLTADGALALEASSLGTFCVDLATETVTDCS